MKKVKLFVSVLAAVVGIGGAYAMSRPAGQVGASPIFNWYDVNDSFQFTGTLNAGLAICNGFGSYCMKGTSPGLTVRVYHNE